MDLETLRTFLIIKESHRPMFGKVIIIGFMLLVAMASAEIKTLEVGPFVVEFDTTGLANVDEDLIFDLESPMQLEDHHEYGVKIEGEDYRIFVTCYDYGGPTDVSELRLMDDIETWALLNGKVDWKLIYSIGGRPGVFGNHTYTYGPKKMAAHNYVASYSPDGVGDHGSIITEFDSTYPEDVTTSFLERIKIKRDG
jgi:hypothetical protein